MSKEIEAGVHNILQKLMAEQGKKRISVLSVSHDTSLAEVFEDDGIPYCTDTGLKMLYNTNEHVLELITQTEWNEEFDELSEIYLILRHARLVISKDPGGYHLSLRGKTFEFFYEKPYEFEIAEFVKTLREEYAGVLYANYETTISEMHLTEEQIKQKCLLKASQIIFPEVWNVLEWSKYKSLKNQAFFLWKKFVETQKNHIICPQFIFKIIIMLQTQNLQNGDMVAVMTTTNGTLKIKLFPELVPTTVLNFAGHAQNGYYNGIVFHRVISNFMIQWGDPTATGMGGESLYGKEFEDEFHPELKNIRWSLSMANAGPNTNGSQFFINQKDNNFLDNKHSVFGQVVEWLENIDKIAGVKTDRNDKPVKDVKIIKLEIKTFENGILKDKKIDIEVEKNSLESKKSDFKKAKQEANKKREVKSWDEIAVHYTGTLASDGSKFDSSYDRGQPLEFEVWTGMMIAWFDAGVVGMKIGEKKTLEIPAKLAYGEYDPENTQEVPKSQLYDFEKAWYAIEVGTTLPTMYGPLKITEVHDDYIVVDANHFLAGKDLVFEVEIVEFMN